jgi:hypothetical protein
MFLRSLGGSRSPTTSLKSIFMVATRRDPMPGTLPPGCIHSCPTTLAGSWPQISTRKLGLRRSGHDRHIPSERYSSCAVNDPAREMVDTSGFFFSEPIPARTARQLGDAILTDTMERRPEIGFTSYDRFSPARIPCRLAALAISSPYRCSQRHLIMGTASSSHLRPYDDQWAFLSSLQRVSTDTANANCG